MNHESGPVTLVEVDYPGGTFGVQSIAAGSSFRYRFHVLATSAMNIAFTDAGHHNHTVAGPELEQGQRGTLTISIEPDGTIRWESKLGPRR